MSATGTIFDSYTDPDIPGIFMSVTDNSIAEDATESQRKVFIAGPTKFGDNTVMTFSKTEQLEAMVGKENTFKYGLGQFYAKSYIEAGATVLFKRIDDDTATYSNQLLYKNPDYYTGNNKSIDPFNALYFSNILEKDTLTTLNPEATTLKFKVSTDGATIIDNLFTVSLDGTTSVDSIINAKIIESGIQNVHYVKIMQLPQGKFEKPGNIQILIWEVISLAALTSVVYTKPVTENLKEQTVFSLLGKGRGKGYNDLFNVFTSAEEYEKFDADQDGIISYKFNFVNGTIYENGSEIKKKSNTILFSLMDIDPVSKNMITHASSGNNLWVNDYFGDSNAYVTAKVNSLYQEEIRKYPNIDAVLADKNRPFFFVESSSTQADSTLNPTDRIWYEVSINDSLTPSTFRIQRATFNARRQLSALPTFAYKDPVSGLNEYYLVTVDDANAKLSLNISKINYVPAGFTATYGVKADGTGEEAYIDGDRAFYMIKLVDNASTGRKEFEFEKFKFLRWELYSYLMQYNLFLDGGSDTVGGSTGFINTDGSANVDAIANGIYDYFRNDKEIREVIYPKYTFNYIIDWTDSIKVKNVLTRLVDRIRRTMHICSCSAVRLNSTGLSPDYSVDNDILCREQYLTFSSYNTMLYTSQRNKAHFDSSTRLTHKLPSSFYALLDHLFVDKEYGITEPVANIDKGIIRTSNLKLSHSIYSEDIEKLRKMQINCIVTDESENYFIDQLTSYKKSSKLSLGNVVKTIQYLQILIPKKLKPFLQKKETDVAITTNVINVIQELLKPYKVSVNSKDAIFKQVTVVPKFDNNILRITLRLTPAGTTEKIQVPIIVGE